MNYQETVEYFEEIKKYGSLLGLTSVRELMRRLDNPQDKIPMIHLAGTNGKGSTSTFLSSIIMEAGVKVGQYISPVVFDDLEKIQINHKNVSKQAFASQATVMKGICLEMVEDGFSHPTVFEIETAIAFAYFLKQKCDVVILETGLGGAEDATNVVTVSKICVFTSISMDHMQFLGDTITKIATEKAGIITSESAVVIGVNLEASIQVLKEFAISNHACIYEVNKNQMIASVQKMEKQIFSYGEMKNLEIHMSGIYQIENASLVIETIHAINETGFIKQKYISEEMIRSGLLKSEWMGRFSVIERNPLFIIDGAHNEDAAKMLKDSMKLYFSDKKIILIMGTLKDKEYEKMIDHLAGIPEQVITVTPKVADRALSSYELALAFRKVQQMVTAADSVEEAVEMAYMLADKNSVIVACGSLYYLGEITEIVKHRKKMKKDVHFNLTQG